MEKLKIVIRKNLPETNSSSSHSVVVDTRNVNYDSTSWNFPIDNKGRIIIPNNTEDFGRGAWTKYNDVLTKTQYVCGQLPGNGDYLERLKEVRDIIKEETGALDVIFQWLVNSYNRFLFPDEGELEDFDAGYEYAAEEYYGPDIDHQSRDLDIEILESKETIRDFIFNTRSWLFIGSDESDIEGEFFNITEIKNTEPKAYLKVEIPGFGDIDFPLSEFPNDLGEFDHNRWFKSEPVKILENISFDIGRKPIMNERSYYSYHGIDRENMYLIWSNCDDTVKYKIPYSIVTEEFGEIKK